MMGIVLHTDVLVAALGSPTGASRQVLLNVLEGNCPFLLSTTLMVEYETVLMRPQNLNRFGLHAGEITLLLDTLAGLCVPVAFDYRWRPEASDPDDDLVLETAINGNASAIISFNLRHLGAAAMRFGIPVLRPGDVLRRIRK